MFCNVCNNKEATVFLTQIIEEKIQKINLCEGCAKVQALDGPAGFPLAEVLLGLGISEGADIKKSSKIELASNEVVCPTCHFSQTDFKKTGRLGCSDCYDVFSEGLVIMLRNMHPGMVHQGKVPATFSRLHAEKLQWEKLKELLQKAIGEEQYEAAARLRDDIRELQESARVAKVLPSRKKDIQKMLPFEEVLATAGTVNAS